MEENPSPFRKLFLIGEFDSILDDKNRILVSADFRNEILDARKDKMLICRIGRNRVARLYPEGYYREMIAQWMTSLAPGEAEEKFNEAYYGMVYRLSWDAQGRVVIPEKIIKRSNMGKTLTLVGKGDHVAIWNRDDWERRAQTNLDTWNDIAGPGTQQQTNGAN
jgi:division/cell wall cluster transcriptional repressor MraZ